MFEVMWMLRKDGEVWECVLCESREYAWILDFFLRVWALALSVLGYGEMLFVLRSWEIRL